MNKQDILERLTALQQSWYDKKNFLEVLGGVNNFNKSDEVFGEFNQAQSRVVEWCARDLNVLIRDIEDSREDS